MLVACKLAYGPHMYVVFVKEWLFQIRMFIEYNFHRNHPAVQFLHLTQHKLYYK
jgi:hypothetical protein